MSPTTLPLNVFKPEIPEQVFNLTDFGGKGDGQFLNTDAFAKAIDACIAAGGGVVRVPKGLWLTGSIKLKSKLRIHLEKGALIQFIDDFNHYPLIESTYEGQQMIRCQAPLDGEGLEHVAITGDGIIDGAGGAWRQVKRDKLTARQWQKLVSSGGVVQDDRLWWPSNAAMNGAEILAGLRQDNSATLQDYEQIREFLRPNMLSLRKCKYILLDGPTFQNSPAWCLHPWLCEHVSIQNVQVRNPWFAQNGDGLDVESCRNVWIDNCSFDVGDDAICMKSGKDAEGRKLGRPTERVWIRNCTVYHGHGGFVIGSEMSGGVRDVTVENCTFIGTDIGLRFKSTRGRGGKVEQIRIKNIKMVRIDREAILFDLHYGLKKEEAALRTVPVTEETPSFTDISMENVVCRGATAALRINGLPEQPVSKITLKNSSFDTKEGLVLNEAADIQLEHLDVRNDTGPTVVLNQCGRVNLEYIDAKGYEDAVIEIKGEESQSISWKAIHAGTDKGKVRIGAEVPDHAVMNINETEETFVIPSKSDQRVWKADLGNGTYRNPILYADYSDPDVIRVGDDFYMTASSFCHVPGLPILHSKDLVNWKLIGHALENIPLPGYDKVRHGDGVWAPSIRYHDGLFWIYFGAPDEGIYMTTAKDPAGPWSPLHEVKAVKGWIDTCPFWDDDGRAYLVHAFAKSRAGFKHMLMIHEMTPDGRELIGDGRMIFDGTDHHPTTEGPKMYKRNGYYYIFAPAGGVSTGWQIVLRSRSPFGPYEVRTVMHQGNTDVNGPHQGGYVELDNGESWFIHFQDREAYGRIVHLQPMHWQDDWPVIGEDKDGGGIGEPVSVWPKPNVAQAGEIAEPATSDDFSGDKLGLQWQWQANPQPEWAQLGRSGLRLFTVPLPGETIYDAPQMLMQKFPAPSFSAKVKLELHPDQLGDGAGLVVFGYKYGFAEVSQKEDGTWILRYIEGNGKQGEEQETASAVLASGSVYLKADIVFDAVCTFSWSSDGEHYEPIGSPFVASKGHWVGAKVGLLACNRNGKTGNGYVDVSDFQIETLNE